MRIILFVALAAIAACGPPYYIANNASAALDCPEDDISVRTLASPTRYNGAAVYVASGCGRHIRYTCVHEDCSAP